jgi:hypothetical protein
MLEYIKTFFWLCSGATISILKRCPTEQSKYAGIGATIFFTGLLAGLSSGYALYSIFDSIGYAILFGTIWGLMIFNLDRLIVLSMRKLDQKHSEFIQAIPRLILAILIALVISKPLEIKIFEKEIATEVQTLEHEILREQESSISLRYNFTLDSLRNETARLTSEVETKQIKRDELFKMAQEEADGTGGTKKRNAGPIYRIKLADAERVQGELEALQSRNNNLMASIEASIKSFQTDLNDNRQKLEEPNMQGLSFKLTALNRLGNKYQTIWLANWFIILLFITIEIAPILTKLISPIGPYDHLLAVHEHFYQNYKKEKVTKSDKALDETLSVI